MLGKRWGWYDGSIGALTFYLVVHITLPVVCLGLGLQRAAWAAVVLLCVLYC